jgi:C4-dicarboxylate-specific signal transduction histidine kinase
VLRVRRVRHSRCQLDRSAKRRSVAVVADQTLQRPALVALVANAAAAAAGEEPSRMATRLALAALAAPAAQ